MLEQYADEALQGAKYGPMQQHGRVFLAVLADIGRAETSRHVQARHLEVDLHRAALPLAADRVS